MELIQTKAKVSKPAPTMRKYRASTSSSSTTQDTTVQPDISVRHLSKVYEGGFRALKDINLEIKRGEIFALLGPNGAGKTTLISIICGIVNPSSGEVKAAGYDIIKEYRQARGSIGLVPQEDRKSVV